MKGREITHACILIVLRSLFWSHKLRTRPLSMNDHEKNPRNLKNTTQKMPPYNQTFNLMYILSFVLQESKKYTSEQEGLGKKEKNREVKQEDLRPFPISRMDVCKDTITTNLCNFSLSKGNLWGKKLEAF